MIEVDVNNAYKLISLGSVIMISSSLNGKLNVMANAWNCPLDFSPSKVLVIVGRESTTRHYIDESGEFIINVASSNQKDLVVKVGSSHGSEVDKFKEYDIKYFLGKEVKAPCIEGSLAYLECKVIKEPEYTKKYDVIIAEVVKAYAEESYFNGQSVEIRNDNMRTLHHLEGGEFMAIGEKV